MEGYTAAASRTLRNIQGLDYDAAMDRFGDEEIYIEILSVFVSDTPHLLDEIRNVGQDGLTAYKVAVHGLKGSCRGISAEPLAKRAEALEHEAGAGNYEYVKAYNADFISGVEKLIYDLTAVV